MKSKKGGCDMKDKKWRVGDRVEYRKADGFHPGGDEIRLWRKTCEATR